MHRQLRAVAGPTRRRRGRARCRTRPAPRRADSGWNAARTLLRSGATQARATPSAPSIDDVRDRGCPAAAHHARLVRRIAPDGQACSLAANPDATQFAAPCHQRWRIDEAAEAIVMPGTT